MTNRMKREPYIKVLAATNSINWMMHRAMAITQAKRQGGVVMDAVEKEDAFYSEVVQQLKLIANDIANQMNSDDMIDEIDTQAINGMMEILNSD